MNISRFTSVLIPVSAPYPPENAWTNRQTPLDPDQLATAFQDALRPLALDPQNSLAVYRAFNNNVLKNLDKVINEANTLLVKSNVLADMGKEAAGKSRSVARNRPRATEASDFGTIMKEPFDNGIERPELFSVIQHLLHLDGPSTPADSDTDGRMGAVPDTGSLPKIPRHPRPANL